MAWLLALALAILILAVGSRLVASITIFEYERALKFVRGKFASLATPGTYWYLPFRTRFHRVDTRLRYEAISGQEVLTSDGVAFKASLLASYRIADPKVAVLDVQDLQGAVHASLQLALRGLIAGQASEDLLQRRAEFSAPLLAESAPQLARLGVELQSVALRDLTLPGDLKKVFSQVAQARQEGLASLERARGETAALRNLANAAQLMERHPQLLQLRLLQVLSERSGHTVVVGGPPPFTPPSVPPHETAAAPSGDPTE